MYDEEILRQRAAKENRNNASLGDEPVMIAGEEYRFVLVSLFEGKTIMRLPETFIEMPEEIAKIKYPMEQRPQIILTSPDTSVNFAFNYFDQIMLEQDVEKATAAFHKVIKRVHPSARVYPYQIKPLGETKIGWFDFKTAGIDEPAYTVMAVTPVASKMLHIIFNCPARVSREWRPVAVQALFSIVDTQ
jgi:hypothetical protein